MKKLQVYFENKKVGWISLDADQMINFDYNREWLDDPKSFAISQQLPLEPVTFVDVAQTYFANLLPEGKIRKILSAKFRISEDNDFQLLAQLGKDCAGALTIDLVQSVSKKQKNKKITLSDIEKIFRQQPIVQLGLLDQEIRLSLAGAQDKLTLRKYGNHFELPLDQRPSTHILKMPSRDYKNIIENEKFLTDLGYLCDLNVADSVIVQCNKSKFLLITRYDRAIDRQVIRRLHQEDFCQALGISYKNKYEEEGGPSFKHCFDLVAEISQDSIKDLETLLKWYVFNIAVGNCDNHGKNLSFLKNKENHKWKLSPIYDLVCTRVYHSISKKQAMSVGGQLDTANLSLKHWQTEFDGLNYKFSRFLDEIAGPTIQTIYLGCDVLLEEKKNDMQIDFYKQLVKTILQQTKRIERSLNLQIS